MGRKSKADQAFEKQFPYLTDKERFLIGWPGYRTRTDKSGLAYAETHGEWAHMQGVMIRKMMIGKFKTRNPVYLICLTLYGLFSLLPVIILFVIPHSFLDLVYFVLNFGLYIIIGTLILINVVLSLIRCDEGESITGD